MFYGTGSSATRTLSIGAGSRFGIALLALCAQALPSASAFGAEAIGTLGSIIGKAQILRDGQNIAAKKGMEIFATDELVTSQKTAVKIFFTDGGNFMAFEDSKVKISEYKFKQEGDTATLKSAFDVAKGKVRFFVKPGADRKNDTKFKTSNAVMGIRGTSGFIDASNPNQTQLVVLTGNVEVSNPKFPGKSVMVPPNQMTDVMAGKAPTTPRAAPPTLVGSLNRQAARVDAKPDGVGADGKGQPSRDSGDGEKKAPAGEEKKGAAPEEKKDGAKPAGESQGAKDGQGKTQAAEGGPAAGGPASSGKADAGSAAAGPSAEGGSPAGGAANATSGDGSAGASAPAQANADGSPAKGDAPVRADAPAAAPAANSAGAGTPASAAAPEPVTLEKKNVFTPDGKSGIVVNDAKLSAITAPVVPGAANSASGATQALRQAQPPAGVIKQVTDSVKTSTDKAVEQRQQIAVQQQQRAAAEAPKSKTVKVKIVFPANP